jgi:hypothetical protein
MKIHSAFVELGRHYYAAIAPPPQVHSAQDAIATLDLIIAGDRLQPGEAVVLARRLKRWIILEHIDK